MHKKRIIRMHTILKTKRRKNNGIHDNNKKATKKCTYKI